jgi:hypothetical protein
MLAAFPQKYFDWCRMTAAISVQGTVTAVNRVRNIRWGVSSNGGIYEQHMAPAINSPYVLGNFTASRLIANAVDTENWTSEFSLGSKAGTVQPPTGTYFQAVGYDQAYGSSGTTPLYNTIINKPDEDDDIAKYGNAVYLSPAGSHKTDWRDNIDVPSSLLKNGVVSTGNIGVYHDLEGKNYNTICYVAPVLPTGSNQSVQSLEITHTVIGEFKTDQMWLQTFSATDDHESWVEAFKLIGTMKHASRRPDPAYYWSTINWIKKKARMIETAGPMVVW